MKTEKNILIAFVLNLAFAVFELFGGIFTGSVAILSDAIHDVGDAASIGVAFFLERKSKRQPNKIHTFGYSRYSVLGSAFTTTILLIGSAAVIYSAVLRIITPNTIDYNGMIVFAVVGVCVNFAAAFLTRKGDSLNQKAVNLHMLEDVLGWVVVLIGAIVMRFTDFYLIDPLMSIGVSIFILINAVKNMKEVLDIFLEKTPRGICIDAIKTDIQEVEGVLDVHHIHVWSMDGQNHCATMHVVTNGDGQNTKKAVRETLKKHGIWHATLELEDAHEHCTDTHCHVGGSSIEHCHHHHHHHHHH